MNLAEALLYQRMLQAFSSPKSSQKPLEPLNQEGSNVITLIKQTQKGNSIMSDPIITIVKGKMPSQTTDKSIKIPVDSFEATDNKDNLRVSITRTADGTEATMALVGIFEKEAPVQVIDGDSGGVTFSLNKATIKEYKYFTREGEPALEYFKIEGKI